MSLVALQSALAEVFTDAVAREQFAANPAGFAKRFGLTAKEHDQLTALGGGPLASYAATLARKRRAEAARLLPETRAALGAEFDEIFERWALANSSPKGRVGQAEDAMRFCRFLRTAGLGRSREVRSAMTWDRNALRAFSLPFYLGVARRRTGTSTIFGVWLKIGRFAYFLKS